MISQTRCMSGVPKRFQTVAGGRQTGVLKWLRAMAGCAVRPCWIYNIYMCSLGLLEWTHQIVAPFFELLWKIGALRACSPLASSRGGQGRHLTLGINMNLAWWPAHNCPVFLPRVCLMSCHRCGAPLPEHLPLHCGSAYSLSNMAMMR